MISIGNPVAPHDSTEIPHSCAALIPITRCAELWFSRVKNLTNTDCFLLLLARMVFSDSTFEVCKANAAFLVPLKEAYLHLEYWNKGS